MDKYIGFTKGTDIEHAKDVFIKRYGYEPLEIIDAGTVWLVGPITQTQPTPTSTGQQLNLFKPVES